MIKELLPLFSPLWLKDKLELIKRNLFTRQALFTLLGVCLFSIASIAQVVSINVGGRTRQMYVTAPTGIPQNQPLVIFMHGWTETMYDMRTKTQFESVARDNGFVLVFPQGIDNTWQLSGDTDINFILAIINEMANRHGIDRNRVYLSGFSMGGMMTYYAATRIADRIAAFAPVGGYLMNGPNTSSSRPIPLLHTHGEQDDFVHYSNVQRHVDAWRTRNGCPSTSVFTKPYPANIPTSQSSKRTWGPCTNGVEVSFITVAGVGHWYSDNPNGLFTSREIWNFCRRFSLAPPQASITIQENTTGFCSVDGTVDSNNAGFTGTGFANTNSAVGASVTWRINAATAGSYPLTWRHANGSGVNRPARLIINGTEVASNINFAATANWTTWTDVSSTFSLAAGQNTISLVSTTSSGLSNIDYLRVTGNNITPVSCSGAIPDVTITIQENTTGFCSVDGTVDNNNAGFTGTGFANANNAMGAGVTWRINTAAAGAYTLIWRHANGSGVNRPGRLLANGTQILSSINFNATTNWTTWVEVSVTVNLSAGQNTLRLESTTAAGLSNVDYLKVTGNNPTGVSCSGVAARMQTREMEVQVSDEEITSADVSPNPTTGLITITLPDTYQDGEKVVNLLDGTGKAAVSEKFSGTTHTLNIGNMPQGMYVLKVISNKKLIVKKVIKK